jgi:hypothetical protein
LFLQGAEETVGQIHYFNYIHIIVDIGFVEDNCDENVEQIFIGEQTTASHFN